MKATHSIVLVLERQRYSDALRFDSIGCVFWTDFLPSQVHKLLGSLMSSHVPMERCTGLLSSQC